MTRTAAILFPAAFIDAVGAGDYTREVGRLHIGCPACGKATDLGAAHRVDGDGVVDPVWTCSACHVTLWLELAGWSPHPDSSER